MEAVKHSCGAAGGRQIALRHDHKQIHIAVGAGFSPRLRAKQNDALGLKFRDEPPGDLAEQGRTEFVVGMVNGVRAHSG